MTERDRKTLDEIRRQTKITTNCELATTRQLIALVGIIDRLDKQLTEVKEVGKPFLVFTENQFGDSIDSEYPIFEEGDFTVGEFRRLAEALKEVKDG